MHIVYVSQEYPPSQRAGGIASYVKEIAAGMLRLGHRVTVITASDDTRQETDSMEDGIRVIRLAGGSFFVKQAEGGSDLKKLRAIYRFYPYRCKLRKVLLSLNDIDVTEVADYDAEGIFLHHLPFPVITRLHTPSLLNRGTMEKNKVPLWKLHVFIRLKAEESVLGKAKYVSSCSQALLDWINANTTFVPRKVAVIRNPVAFEPIGIDGSMGKPEKKDRFIIFYAGTISSTKGVMELYRACKRLNANGTKVTLLLAGKQGGSFASQLKEDIAQDGSSWCQFLGQLPRRELYPHYASADVCCFPSWWENMPMVCLEAMMCGSIVVGSNSGGMNEIIKDGYNGFLAPRKNDELLAHKLLQALQLSDAEKNDIRQAAMKTIREEFSIDIIAKQMETFYKEVINDHGHEH